MSKHAHPEPRITISMALKVLAEILIGLPATEGRRVNK